MLRLTFHVGVYFKMKFVMGRFVMEKKGYQRFVCVEEDLNTLYDGEEETVSAPYQSTDEMRERLKKNLIDEGFLELITLQ